MQALLDLGQSVWLDYLRRGMLQSGELQRMIDDGLRGMTSNPTIFEHAIGGSTDYDHALSRVAASPRTDREIFELLAVEDVRTAADAFRPVYDASQGADGFVSLEVSPTLARDTAGTIGEARRLWAAVDRPNVMIKVPGTREGWPAIERLLTDGINVNITLLFSLEHYRQVAEAYVRALEARRKAGQAIDRVASVASFFVSRVDTEVDRRLDAKGGAPSGLRGKIAIANAQLAYAWFRELLQGRQWRSLAAAGAKPQRLLWASTGTKDPAYSDVLYVDSLIGADTINTLPPQTLQLFEDHGTVREALPGDAADAQRVMHDLRAAAIDFGDVARVLEAEGIEKFAHSFETLLGVIAAKRKTLVAAAPPRHSAELRAFDQAVARRLAGLPGALGARQHRPACGGRRARRRGHRAHAVPRFEQVRDDAGDRLPVPPLLGANARPGRAVRGHYRPRHTARSARRGARISSHVPEPQGHRRSLFRPVLFRARPGGPDRHRRGPAAAPGASHGRGVRRVGSGTPEPRRVARGHSRGSRTGGPQQDHVRPVAGDREVRAVGRAVDRGEHRQGGEGDPARRRRAAGPARGVRARPCLRIARAYR